MKKFSFFEIDSRFEHDIVKAFRKTDFNGIPLKVELSTPDTKAFTRQNDQFRKKKRKKPGKQ